MELPEDEPAGLAVQDEMPGDRGGARQRRKRRHGRRRGRQAERQQHQAEFQAGEGSRDHKNRAPDASGSRVPAPVDSSGSPPLDLEQGRPFDPPASTGTRLAAQGQDRL
jgi:hypothetical protein